MQRAILSLAAAAALAAGPLVPGASPAADGSATGRVTGHITLRLRYKNGPWVSRLSLKLLKTQLRSYRVCGSWNWPASRRFTCLGAGVRLPERTKMQIEQNPVAKAMKQDSTPGWGLLGISTDPVVRVVLSNTETGNNYGTFYYRVTLRDTTGQVLVTSNRVKLVWHR